MARYRVIEIIETDGFGNERKLYTIQIKKFYYLFYKNLHFGWYIDWGFIL